MRALPLADNLPHLNGIGKPFEVMSPEIRVFERATDQRAGSIPENNPARRCHRLQPGREVRRLADDGLLLTEACLDDSDARRLVRPVERAEIFGVEHRRKLRRSDEIGKQNRQLPTLRLRRMRGVGAGRQLCDRFEKPAAMTDRRDPNPR